jgi:hypothetical protein
MTNGIGSPYAGTGWAAERYARSRRSSRPTRFSGGIGSLLHASGRTPSVRTGARAYSRRSDDSSCAWRRRNPTWGCTRIRGALKNVGHRVGRSTIARILRAQGIPPVPERPTSWRTFLRAHWGAIAGADFFTTEVWTWRQGVSQQSDDGGPRGASSVVASIAIVFPRNKPAATSRCWTHVKTARCVSRSIKCRVRDMVE